MPLRVIIFGLSLLLTVTAAEEAFAKPAGCAASMTELMSLIKKNGYTKSFPAQLATHAVGKFSHSTEGEFYFLESSKKQLYFAVKTFIGRFAFPVYLCPKSHGRILAQVNIKGGLNTIQIEPEVHNRQFLVKLTGGQGKYFTEYSGLYFTRENESLQTIRAQFSSQLN